MAIKRLVPTRKPLGYLRLWRDDLADVIALAGKIEGATIYLEADDCAISDPEADLPRLGKRLRYLTVKAVVTTKSGSGPVAFGGVSIPERSLESLEVPADALTIRFTKSDSVLEATDPSMQTRGVIADIEERLGQCRRVPMWFPRFPTPESPADKGTRLPRRIIWDRFWFIMFVLAIVWPVITFISPDKPTTHEGAIPLAAKVIGDMITVPLIGFMIVSWALSKTIICTGLRAEAPTFWRKNGTSIALAVVSFAAGSLVTWLVTRYVHPVP